MKKIKLKEHSVIRASLFGLLASVIIAAALVAIVSIFIKNEYIDITSISLISYIIMFASVLVGGVVGGSAVSGKKWRVHIAVGCAYFLLTVCVALACFEGLAATVTGGLITCLISVIVAILTSKFNKKGDYRNKRKRRSC